jgi:hypothetical protein
MLPLVEAEPRIEIMRKVEQESKRLNGDDAEQSYAGDNGRKDREDNDQAALP